MFSSESSYICANYVKIMAIIDLHKHNFIWTSKTSVRNMMPFVSKISYPSVLNTKLKPQIFTAGCYECEGIKIRGITEIVKDNFFGGLEGVVSNQQSEYSVFH
jgi:hypothetical protein